MKETQSQSFDLIRRLELHVRRLNEARSEDKRQIRTLERELSNSHQEIDYLQDQLNASNAEVTCLEQCVASLQMKLAAVDLLEEEIVSLREELNKSNSECEFLMQELDTKEAEIQESSLQIEKLEESMACAALEYQCEIESMKLDVLSLEQREMGPCNDVMGPMLPEVLKIGTSSDAGLEGGAEKMSGQLHEYEELVKRLKEELREEKLRAKEEAEELAQEMAELRYQMTELLEEERKRRACIEQASLQRISELEAQLQMEQRKLVPPVSHICQA